MEFEVKVSILVPCRNEIEHIETFLKNMASIKFPDGGLEIIIIDGQSTDGTKEYIDSKLTELGIARLIENPDLVVSSGLNKGLRVARGEIIVRMDVHCEYDREYLCKCIDLLEERRGDNVGGACRARGKTYIARAIGAAFQSGLTIGGARSHDLNYEGIVDSVFLGCWRKEVFDAVGDFDEELIRNQDDEFNIRMRKCGYSVWQSRSVKSWYAPRKTLWSLFRQYTQYGYWKVAVIKKHKSIASLRHLVPGFLCGVLMVLGYLCPFFCEALLLLGAVLGSYALYIAVNCIQIGIGGN